MPRSMLRRLPIVACALALAAPLGLVACGDDEQGIDEPAREGLAIELGGVDYTVFITRELNPDITPDNAYVTTEAPPGEALYGVFLRACNVSDDQREAASEFVVKDNQENTFEPESLPDFYVRMSQDRVLRQAIMDDYRATYGSMLETVNRAAARVWK